MRKILTLILLILGAFIGASFSSGREIYVYFAQYGILAIPLAVIVGFVLYLIMYFFLNFKMPEKKNGVFLLFEIVLVVATFVLSATMFAGCNELSTTFGGGYLILITLAISLVQCFVDIKGLKFVNYILMPVILLSLIFMIFTSDWGVVGSSQYISAISSGVKYIGTNCILLSIFLMQVGKGYTKREKKIASIIVAVVLTLFVVFISLMLMGQTDEIKMSSLPLVILAFNKNILFGKILCIVVWFGLITTLLSGLYVVCKYVKNNNSYVKVFVVLMCFLFSYLGWEILTSKVYSIVGICSIVGIIVLLLDYTLRDRKIYSYHFKKRKK